MRDERVITAMPPKLATREREREREREGEKAGGRGGRGYAEKT
jgi:hypothetical protein